MKILDYLVAACDENSKIELGNYMVEKNPFHIIIYELKGSRYYASKQFIKRKPSRINNEVI